MTSPASQNHLYVTFTADAAHIRDNEGYEIVMPSISPVDVTQLWKPTMATLYHDGRPVAQLRAAQVRDVATYNSKGLAEQPDDDNALKSRGWLKNHGGIRKDPTKHTLDDRKDYDFDARPHRLADLATPVPQPITAAARSH